MVEEAKDQTKFSTPKPGAKPKQLPNRPVIDTVQDRRRQRVDDGGCTGERDNGPND